jgi:hypothetical protein
MKTTAKINLMALTLAALFFIVACNKTNPFPTKPSPKYLIKLGMTTLQIDSVIAKANAFDTVFVEPGNYAITSPVQLKAQITLMGLTNKKPVFDATNVTYFLNFDINNNKHHVVISGITFWNIRLNVVGVKGTVIKDCVFDYEKRKPNSNKSNNLADDYISLGNCDSALVANCTLLHRQDHPGRGIFVRSGATNTRIIDNVFGKDDTTGCFVTAINDNSKLNTLISGNKVNRNAVFNPAGDLTDHGIYAHSFNGLTIVNNTISGWPANGSGGSVKARNGQHLVISNNIFNGSGILLYEYKSNVNHPFLKYVVVANNTINIGAPVMDLYHGIGYYRDSYDVGHGEYSIKIENNQLPNGTLVIGARANPENFNAEGGGVFNNNTAEGYFGVGAAIKQSGNY